MFGATHLFRIALAALASLALSSAALPPAALAQELLVNGSFECPRTPANGNNFYTSIGLAAPSPPGELNVQCLNLNSRVASRRPAQPISKQTLKLS